MQLGLKLLQWLHVEYILWNFPPTKHTSVHPHHAKSSNNSAEPDLNQNLNLTARCPSHDPTHHSDSDLLLPSHFQLTFLSTSSCQRGSLWDVERKKKRRGMNRDSGSVAERDWWNKKLKESGGVGWRKKYEMLLRGKSRVGSSLEKEDREQHWENCRYCSTKIYYWKTSL